MAQLGLMNLSGVVRVLIVMPALALAGCALPKVLGDNPADGSSGSSGGASSESGGESSESGGPTTGGPAGCDNPAFTCSVPVDCEQWQCGALGSPFDAAGCLRPRCVDEPCGADEICYSVGEGDCGALDVIGCGDVDGACSCEFSPRCGGNHCIPADEGPPVLCPEITEEAACEAAGCSEFTTIAPWSMVDGACVQGPVEPLCMWFPGDAWGGTASPAPFYEIATGRAELFSTGWVDPPIGWAPCGGPDSPPACACVGQCALAQMDGDGFLAGDQACADASDCVLADAVCYEGNVCGSVAVHKDSAALWSEVEANLEGLGCCAGADPCGASVACEDQRCVVKFP